MNVIELTEYKTETFEREEIEDAIATKIFQNHKNKIYIEYPTPYNNHQWKLKSEGWVGHISVTPDFEIFIRPKVPIRSIFKMWEYAYNLGSFKILEGLVNCESVEDFYSQFASILAKKILQRAKKGFYRTYLPTTEKLAYVRGKVNVRQAITKPWDVKLTCHYSEHTGDISDNQILAWTLYIIARSGLCRPEVATEVRKAFHALQGLVTLKEFSGIDCIEREYNRLNSDYQLLHAICRFFLENTVPNHSRGNKTALPFLVNMANLYERFVAEWLKQHLPLELKLKYQQRIDISSNVYFNIDLLICERATGKVRFVLDTKYKYPNSPASNDVSQVVSYAASKDCQKAVLIYPIALQHPINNYVGDFHVRSLTFALDDDLEAAGKRFLADLGLS